MGFHLHVIYLGTNQSLRLLHLLVYCPTENEITVAFAAINILREFCEALELREKMPDTEGRILLLVRKIYLELEDVPLRQVPDEVTESIANTIILATKDFDQAVR